MILPLFPKGHVAADGETKGSKANAALINLFHFLGFKNDSFMSKMEYFRGNSCI